MADLHQLLGGYFLGKAQDLIVAGVHLEQRRRLFVYGPLIILGMGLVGGAHLHQGGIALLHDLRHPERAADLHQFPPGYDDVPVFGHGAQDQHHSGGVVVDYQGRFCPGEPAQQLFHMVVPAAPPARFTAVFQRVVVFRHFHHMLCHLVAQHGTAQIGVQHDARGVDDRAQTHAAGLLHRGQHQALHLLHRNIRGFPFQYALAQPFCHLAHRLGDCAAAIFRQLGHSRPGQHLVHFGDLAQQFFSDLHLYLNHPIRVAPCFSDRPAPWRPPGMSALLYITPGICRKGMGKRSGKQRKGRECSPALLSSAAYAA